MSSATSRANWSASVITECSLPVARRGSTAGNSTWTPSAVSESLPTKARGRLTRWFARLLPREFRQRVFEPSLSDLELDELEEQPQLGASHGGFRWRRAARRMAFWGACIRVGVPLLFWRNGRLTRLSTMLIIGAAVSLVAIQRVEYGKRHIASGVRR
jgi:hypothetical protein